MFVFTKVARSCSSCLVLKLFKVFTGPFSEQQLSVVAERARPSQQSPQGHLQSGILDSLCNLRMLRAELCAVVSVYLRCCSHLCSPWPSLSYQALSRSRQSHETTPLSLLPLSYAQLQPLLLCSHFLKWPVTVQFSLGSSYFASCKEKAVVSHSIDGW